MQYDALLTHARFVFEPHPHLEGRIWHDSKGRFNDGDSIHTSRLLSQEAGHIFVTKNTRYLVVLS